MARAMTVRAYAKINWTLHVGATRDDGFHDVRTELQSIALSDRLVIAPCQGPLRIECAAPNVPASQDNLVWRAAASFWRALRRAGDPRDLTIAIHKQIPVAAGLGGGSADAAATLVALNRMWSAGWTRARLIALAAELGSDVPFFLMGGRALASGRGEKLRPLRDLQRQSLVVIKPSVDVRTADAYRWLDVDRAKGSNDPKVPNELQPAVIRRRPIVGEIIDAALAAGAKTAAMTGSGSAVFAVFRPGAAARAAARLRRGDWQVAVTRTLTRREASRAGGV